MTFHSDEENLAMFNWLKRKTIFRSKDPTPADLKRAISGSAVDRRQHPRVKYPPKGFEFLPRFVSEKGDFQPADISLGGMLLKNPPIRKPRIGARYAFKSVWPSSGLELSFEADLLRVQGPNWHFKFTTVDSRFVVEFPRVFKGGLRGYHLRQFDSGEIPPGQSIEELWLSENGDLVMFQRFEPQKPALITVACGRHRVQFNLGCGLLLGEQKAPGQWSFGTPAPKEVISEIVFMLANIRRPSLKVTKLLSDILAAHFSAEKVA